VNTTKEVAQHFKVSEQTVRRWTKEGCPFITPGRKLIFDIEKVKEWLERGKK